MNLLLPRPLKREMSCAACGLSARNLCGYGNCDTRYCSQDCAEDHHENHIEDCAGFQMKAVGGEFHEVNDISELDRLRETREVSTLCKDRMKHNYLRRKFFTKTRVLVYRNDNYDLEGVLTWRVKNEAEEINACSKSGGGRMLFDYWLENYHDPSKEIHLEAIPQAVGFWKKMGFIPGESRTTIVPKGVIKVFESIDWIPMNSFDGDPIKRTPDIDKWLQNYALGLKFMGFFTGTLVYQEPPGFAKAVEYIQAHKNEFIGDGTLLMHYEPPKKSKRVKR